MSLAEACTWSVVRAVLVALMCLPVARLLWALLRCCGSRARFWLVAALLLPVLIPELVIGFVYSEATLRVVRALSDPTAEIVPPTQLRMPATMDRPVNSADIVAELLYASLLLFRFVPIAALVMWLMPAPRLSAEAVHCRRLLLASEASPWQKFRVRFGLFARGPLMAMLPAFAIVFLLTFQEFEIASLMQVSRAPVAWTVWLFDSNAGGQILSLSLWLSIGPLICELLVVGIALFALMRGDWNQTESLSRAAPGGLLRTAAAMGFLSASIVFLVGIPLGRLAGDLFAGFDTLTSERIGGFAEEMSLAVAYGLTAALIAFWISGLLFARRRVRTGATLLASLPGLIGSLVLSLLMLKIFQQPLLAALYDTPMPLVLTLALFFIPRAVLLRIVFFSKQPREPLKLADLMRHSTGSVRSEGRRLSWALRVQPAFWVVALLAYWGYWDLTASSILRPVQMPPFTPELYNQMHYRQGSTVAAMSLLAGLLPLALVGTVELTRSVVQRFV